MQRTESYLLACSILARRHRVQPAMPATPHSAAAARLAFTKLAVFYAATFASLGVFMQFFPVWLHRARGLDEAAVTLVVSAQIWARTIAGPLFSQWVDRTGNSRRVLCILATLSVIAMLAFGAAKSVVALFFCSVLFGCVYSPQFAILDGFALHSAHQFAFSFTRCRVWGSLSFLGVIALVGHLLDGAAGEVNPTSNANVIFVMLVACLCLAFFAGFSLPSLTQPVARGDRAPVWVLLRQSHFVLFLLAVGLIGGSHAAYYSLSTLYWLKNGMGEHTASFLWGEGLLAEILLFLCVRSMTSSFRPTTWILIGAVGAVLRWFVIGCTTEPWVLFGINWLHGASFGCTFLGSMQFIRLRVPPEFQATAQGLLGAVSSGICSALCTQIAGKAYMSIGGGTFFLMCGVAFAGLVLTLVLRQRRRVQLV